MNIKSLAGMICALLTLYCAPAKADPLRFSSESITNGLVTLNIAGNSNLVCQLEQLNPTNDTWTVMSAFLLDSSGSYTLTNGLINGYGYFRVKATNGTYLSTNAVGAMSLTLPQGYSLIGNPFSRTHSVWDIFPSPANGTRVYPSTTNGFAPTSTYAVGSWTHSYSFTQGEGFLVYAPNTNTVIQFWGEISTNSFTKALAPGWSILTSPLYHLESFSGFRLDSLDNVDPGGLTSLPVLSGASIDVVSGHSGPTYDAYTFTNGNWMLGTNTATVPITWGQGFWFYNPGANPVDWTIDDFPIW